MSFQASLLGQKNLNPLILRKTEIDNLEPNQEPYEKVHQRKIVCVMKAKNVDEK